MHARHFKEVGHDCPTCLQLVQTAVWPKTLPAKRKRSSTDVGEKKKKRLAKEKRERVKGSQMIPISQLASKQPPKKKPSLSLEGRGEDKQTALWEKLEGLREQTAEVKQQLEMVKVTYSK